MADDLICSATWRGRGRMDMAPTTGTLRGVMGAGAVSRDVQRKSRNASIKDLDDVMARKSAPYRGAAHTWRQLLLAAYLYVDLGSLA